jgi:hypothetical protein
MTTNTTSDSSPEFELPEPQVGHEVPVSAAVDSLHEQQRAVQVEQGVGVPASQPTSQGPAPVSVPSLNPVVDNGELSQTGQATPHPTQGLQADDGDLIEKEWVIRAKQIVEHTKFDPHLQTKELGKVRSDYMKKRYDKDLKLDGEP